MKLILIQCSRTQPGWRNQHRPATCWVVLLVCAGFSSRENSEQTQKIKLFIIHTRTSFIKKLLWKFLYFFRLWGPLIKDKVYFVKQNHFQTHNKPRNCAVVFHSCKQTVCVKCTPNVFSQNKPLPRMCRRSASENPSVKMSRFILFTSNTRSSLLWTSLPTVRLNPKEPPHESGIPDSEEEEEEEETVFYGQRQHDWTLQLASNLPESHRSWLSTSEADDLESAKAGRDLDSLVRGDFLWTW